MFESRRVDNSSVRSSYACDSLKLLQTGQLVEFWEIDLTETNDISRELLHYSVTKYHFLQLSPLEVPTTNESTFTIRKKIYSVTNRMTFLATVTGTGLPNQQIGVNTSY